MDFIQSLLSTQALNTYGVIYNVATPFVRRTATAREAVLRQGVANIVASGSRAAPAKQRASCSARSLDELAMPAPAAPPPASPDHVQEPAFGGPVIIVDSLTDEPEIDISRSVSAQRLVQTGLNTCLFFARTNRLLAAGEQIAVDKATISPKYGSMTLTFTSNRYAPDDTFPDVLCPFRATHIAMSPTVSAGRHQDLCTCASLGHGNSLWRVQSTTTAQSLWQWGGGLGRALISAFRALPFCTAMPGYTCCYCRCSCAPAVVTTQHHMCTDVP